MSALFKRKGSPCCVAVGCSMKSGTNLLSEVKMFSFPRNPDRRQRWEIAVHRENWKATSSSKLCNRHFITGKPSTNPLHPDYVPSIFCQKNVSSQAVDRHERHAKRMKIDETKTTSQASTNDTASTHKDIVEAASRAEDSPTTETENTPELREASTMTDLSKDDIEKLEHLLEGHKSHLKVMQESVLKNTFSGKLMANLKNFQFYTKLPSFALFFGLLNLILSNWKPVTKTSLEFSDQLLLVLVKLRLGLLNEDLAYRFGISKGTVSCSFREWITRMAQVLTVFIKKPDKKTIRKNMPKCFVDANLQNVSCIIDCSEIFIQKPFNLDARAQTYSNYKNHNTVKFLISCSPSGSIDFISNLYGGRTSDKEITKFCGFLDTVKKNDVILADRGFKIEDLVALKEAQVIIPASTRNKTQLTGAEVINSRSISSVRVHIERCIGRIKSYGIVKTTWPITYFKAADNNASTGDNILTVIAALCNFTKPEILKL